MKDCQKNIDKHTRCNDTPQNENEINEDQAESVLNSLKEMVIRDDNITDAVEKLNLTRKYRKLLAVKDEVDLRQKFPFILSNPKLVSFIFKY